MGPLAVSFASRAYDGIMPIIRGEVGIPGVNIQPRLDNNVPRVFASLFTGQVDMSEMSLAELIYYTSRGKADFVAIPVFPSRIFRHGYLFYDPKSGISGPRDLNGRRLGFQRWVQTAGVWQRGILVEHYGVSPVETQWFVGSIHHWADHAEETIEPRDGSEVRRYKLPSDPQTADSFGAIAGGEVDVVGVTENQAPQLLADGRFQRVFPDYRREEMEYYRKTRIFPIMHVLSMRRSLAEEHPELPAELFRLFSESKKLAQRSASELPSWALAWTREYMDGERELFGNDLWPFGVAANQHVIDTFFGYCWQQGIAARQMAAAELFHPSTAELVETPG
jgi:4,5-dihydroxyphthalate decarboxylase